MTIQLEQLLDNWREARLVWRKVNTRAFIVSGLILILAFAIDLLRTLEVISPWVQLGAMIVFGFLWLHIWCVESRASQVEELAWMKYENAWAKDQDESGD